MEEQLNRKSKLIKYLGLGIISGILTLGFYKQLPEVKKEFDFENKLKEKEELLSYDSLPKSELEKKVELFIKTNINKKNLSNDEKTAWSVYDLSTGKEIVSINEDIPLQCASMVKPFVALAFYHLEKEGKLKYGSESKKKMEEMIQKSSNQSTNWVMGQIGGPKKVQKILEENYPEIFKQTQIKEYIPRGGRTYKNKASANDYNRFLCALWKDELPNSKEIKRLMSLPNGDRIYTGVRNIPKGTIVYDKTGTTSHLVGDMGILSIKTKEGLRKQYTVIGIIEKEKKLDNSNETKKWWDSRSNIIRDFSGLVYEDIKKGSSN